VNWPGYDEWKGRQYVQDSDAARRRLALRKRREEQNAQAADTSQAGASPEREDEQ
jgi:hypothetical protein